MRPDNDFFNEANPRSFINLLPTKMKLMVLSIPEEFWELSERDLIRAAYGKDKLNLPELDAKMRISLWREFDFRTRAEYVTPMIIQDFLKGIMPHKSFYREMEENPARLKLLVIEPQDTWVKYEDILQMSTDEMRKIVEMPIAVNIRTGLPGYDLLKLKFDIFQYLDTRQHGAITQKIKTESLNVHIDAPSTNINKYRSIEELDAEIKRLEQSSRRSLPAVSQALQPLLQMEPAEVEVLMAEEKG